MSLPNKVAQFDADSNLVNTWVHGGPATSITTDSGLVRSPAKLIADLDASINIEADGILAQVEAVAASINVVAERVDAIAASTFTTSSGDAVKITNTGTGNSFVVEDSASTDSTPFVIDANGRVILGYTAAITGAGANTAHLQTHATSVFSLGLNSTYWAAEDANPSQLQLLKSRGAAIGTRGIVSSGDETGRIIFADDDGATFIPSAYISSFVDGTPGTNDMPGRLVFSTTADGASFPTERMRIDSAGNVGIGGAASGAKLDVTPGGTANAIRARASSSNIGILQFTDSGATTEWGYVACNVGSISINHDSVTRLMTAGVERIRADSTGVLVKDVIGLGYGPGAGGTVTQATSKSTAVTLNKPCGQITMHNAALAAGASVVFTLYNTLMTTTDVVVVAPSWGAVDPNNYSVSVFRVGASACSIRVTNTSAGSLSETLVINFAIIKVATS